MADVSPRLGLALDKGLLALPDDGTVLLLNPPGNAELAGLPVERLMAVQPMRPDHDMLARRGVAVQPVLPDGGRYCASVVFLPRAKAQARALIAAASALSDGPVVVDGAKSDGIDSILKDVRGRRDVAGSYSKAHGKIFWFDPGDADFPDWQAQPHSADGFLTAPGVFSADGIDPASALLARHLPARMGAHVVDLGAGWGYLGNRVLEIAAPERLDLVEADHVALECARQNVDHAAVRFFWADARDWVCDKRADTVVMNPPFHPRRAADPALGQAFIANAARILAPQGILWMVANRHLPYEAALQAVFARVDEIGGDARFKIFRAERPSRRRG